MENRSSNRQCTGPGFEDRKTVSEREDRKLESDLILKPGKKESKIEVRHVAAKDDWLLCAGETKKTIDPGCASELGVYYR